jgi:hypothetical protein
MQLLRQVLTTHDWHPAARAGEPIDRAAVEVAAGEGMGFDLAARGPVVGGIVMAHATQHHAAFNAKEDQPDVSAGADRTGVLVLMLSRR